MGTLAELLHRLFTFFVLPGGGTEVMQNFSHIG
jgi:hypothetical protein